MNVQVKSSNSITMYPIESRLAYVKKSILQM